MKRLFVLSAMLLALALRAWADDTATSTATPSPTATSTPAPVYSLPFVDHFTTDLGWSVIGSRGTSGFSGGTGTDGDMMGLFLEAPIPQIIGYVAPMLPAISPSINASGAGSLKLRYAGWNIGAITVSVYDGSAWVDLQNFGSASYTSALGIVVPAVPAIPSQGSALVQEAGWGVWEFDLSAYKNAALQVRFLGLNGYNVGFDWVEVYDPSVTSLPVYPTFTISPTFSATPMITATTSATPTQSVSPTQSPTFTTSPTPSVSPTVTRTAICPKHGTVRICPNPAEDGKAHFYFNLHGPCTVRVVLRNAAAAQVATASAHLTLADPLLSLRLGKLARGIYYYSIELDYDDGSRETVQQGKFYKL